MNRSISLLLAMLLGFTLSGCATFDREWRLWSAPDPAPPKGVYVLYRKTEPPPTPQSPFDGRWTGTWTSNRHRKPFSNEWESGSVRAIITTMDPYRFRANFRAHWLLGSDDFCTHLYGHGKGKVFHLKGSEPLSPIFGGRYTYDGRMTPTHFSMHYDSKYDSGAVELRKIP